MDREWGVRGEDSGVAFKLRVQGLLSSLLQIGLKGFELRIEGQGARG
jgi:hypothetical protein